MNTYLEPEQVERLAAAAPNLRDRLLIVLLFHLGCRVSEALGLEAKDVDINKGTVIIQHLKSCLNLACPKCGARLGKGHTFCPKCGDRVEQVVAKELEHRRLRTLPIDGDTLALLKEYVERCGPVERDGRKMIFGINRHRAWQIVRECAQKAGLPDLVNPETGRIRGVSPHRLRDAFAVHAVKTEWRPLRLLCQHQ